LESWGTDIEVVRRTKSGAVASDIYSNKIVGEKSYMQATSTRIVAFEMCGNDFLQARSNFANTYGFKCIDDFAQYMGADYDSNGDSQSDSDALRYVQGESEADYVTRISVTLRSTIRDANTHFVNASTSYDYIQSDDTHPTYYGSATSAWDGVCRCSIQQRPDRS